MHDVVVYVVNVVVYVVVVVVLLFMLLFLFSVAPQPTVSQASWYFLYALSLICCVGGNRDLHFWGAKSFRLRFSPSPTHYCTLCTYQHLERGGGHGVCGTTGPPPSPLFVRVFIFRCPRNETKIGTQFARFMDGCARARLNDFRLLKPSPNQVAQVHRYRHFQIDRRTTVQPTQSSHTPKSPKEGQLLP